MNVWDRIKQIKIPFLKITWTTDADGHTEIDRVRVGGVYTVKEGQEFEPQPDVFQDDRDRDPNFR